jgi:GT2 family glycosyltransferase
MSISVVIPAYTLNVDLETMCYNCARGYRGFADELIIVEDGGRNSPALRKLADKYIRHPDNVGFTKNCNMGWKEATGDYVFIVNSDTYIQNGNYEDLCIPGKVTSPRYPRMIRMEGFLCGSFFVVPREVTESRGMLDERYRTYYSDDDYGQRVRDIFQTVTSVEIGHVYGATTSTLGEEWRDNEAERDRKIFESLQKSGYYERVVT